jgi:hypothetical protein
MAFMFIILFRRLKKNNFQVLLKYSIVFFFITTFNLLTIYKAYKIDFRYIPYHSYLETFFYDIPYEKTAQYKHMQEQFGVSDMIFYQYKK